MGLLAGCQTTVDSVGHNDPPEVGPNRLADVWAYDDLDSAPDHRDAEMSDADASILSDAAHDDVAPEADRSDALDALPDTPPVIHLRSLKKPSSYPNLFRDVLLKTEDEITRKIDGAFNLLFYGDSSNEPIYELVGSDEAKIVDNLHGGDVRTEGMSYGMLIALELDKRDVFDRLWRYSKTELRYADGPNSGYFRSFCDVENESGDGVVPCIDPFGLQQFTMALIFAHNRWGADAGFLDYESDALSLLDLMLHKEDQSGGIVSEVTNTFDKETRLVFHEPNLMASTFSRPAIEMPAYYELWAQATGNSFWADAAAKARAYWKRVAHPTTGLMPIRAYFEGTACPGWDIFAPEGYRVQINIVLDHLWTGPNTWEIDESNRLLQFFANEGISTYGKKYSLDGSKCYDTRHEASLVATNGATTLVAAASIPKRAEFVSAVWNLELPPPSARYYPGILQMVSLLALSGRLRVY